MELRVKGSKALMKQLKQEYGIQSERIDNGNKIVEIGKWNSE